MIVDLKFLILLLVFIFVSWYVFPNPPHLNVLKIAFLLPDWFVRSVSGAVQFKGLHTAVYTVQFAAVDCRDHFAVHCSLMCSVVSMLVCTVLGRGLWVPRGFWPPLAWSSVVYHSVVRGSLATGQTLAHACLSLCDLTHQHPAASIPACASQRNLAAARCGAGLASSGQAGKSGQVEVAWCSRPILPPPHVPASGSTTKPPTPSGYLR